MDRPEIYQRVIDALGKILVDKDPIRDDALMSDMILDKEDFDQFFRDLQSDLGIVMPPHFKSELAQLSDDNDHRELTLNGFVDKIEAEMRKRNLLER